MGNLSRRRKPAVSEPATAGFRRRLPRGSIARRLCSPASSCSKCQFSSRSCLAASSVADGLPSLSKCLTKRPSLRAKSMKSTCFARLRVHEPVVLHRRVALQRQPLLDRVARCGDRRSAAGTPACRRPAGPARRPCCRPRRARAGRSCSSTTIAGPSNSSAPSTDL